MFSEKSLGQILQQVPQNPQQAKIAKDRFGINQAYQKFQETPKKPENWTYHSENEPFDIKTQLRFVNEDWLLGSEKDRLEIQTPNEKYFAELLAQNPGFSDWAEKRLPRVLLMRS